MITFITTLPSPFPPVFTNNQSGFPPFSIQIFLKLKNLIFYYLTQVFCRKTKNKNTKGFH